MWSRMIALINTLLCTKYVTDINVQTLMTILEEGEIWLQLLLLLLPPTITTFISARSSDFV